VLCGVHVWLTQVLDASKHVEQAFQVRLVSWMDVAWLSHVWEPADG
jgi:hypothetical protein